MNKLELFYNSYHNKNSFFYKPITAGNFTYFYILQLLQKADSLRGRTILDVGCGVGALSFYFASQGAKAVVGVDVSSRAIQIAQAAQDKLQFPTIFFKQGELVNNMYAFDILFCSEVIEHVADDSAFLHTLCSNIKPGGTLLLTTPSKENALFKFGFYKKFDKEVGHERRYTKEGLAKLILSHGFEIQVIREVEGPLRNILFTTKLGFIIRFIRGPLVPLFHFFDTLSAKIFGASDIQVIAKKL